MSVCIGDEQYAVSSRNGPTDFGSEVRTGSGWCSSRSSAVQVSPCFPLQQEAEAPVQPPRTAVLSENTSPLNEQNESLSNHHQAIQQNEVSTANAHLIKKMQLVNKTVGRTNIISYGHAFQSTRQGDNTRHPPMCVKICLNGFLGCLTRF